MAYTAVNDPEAFMVPRIYDGTGSSQTISCGFQPDMSWVKSRNNAYSNRLADSVRGYTNTFITDGGAASATDATIFSGTTSDGFTVVSDNGSNATSNNYIGWSWKAGTTGTDLSAGTITPSSSSINTTAGFGIYAYAGNSTSGATIAHGLGVVPTMVIIKEVTDVDSWCVYQVRAGNNKILNLNDANAGGSSSTHWNDTTPTSTVFTLGNSNELNDSSETYIAYVWADVQGYSRMGSYEGNGAGPLVYLGFRPAFIMIKSIGAITNWTNRDVARDTFNPTYNYIYPNLNNAGTDIGPPATSGSYAVDFLCNGFKIRNTDGKLNTDGDEYIYMAFAEAPWVNSNNVPGNAR